MTEITLSNGRPLRPVPASPDTFRGPRLPGAELFQLTDVGINASIHFHAGSLFSLSLLTLNSTTRQSLEIREQTTGLRFEAMIKGELTMKYSDGSQTKLLAGQYHFTDLPTYQSVIREGSEIELFICYLSPTLLTQIHADHELFTSSPKMAGLTMRSKILQILANPFEPRFRAGFYDYSIRELVFMHLTSIEYTAPGRLTSEDIAAVYAADEIMTANLNQHFTIPELAKLVHTNAYLLKLGFARVFNVGIFERLLSKKMERAQWLLEKTDKLVQEVAEETGYETLTGFINAFRREFGLSPRAWRKKNRGFP